MNFKTKRWTRRFDFFALASWLILSLGLAIVSLVWFGVDFRGYYAAARVLMMGGNPYDYHQVAPELLRVTGEMGNNPYYYPPWFAWLFLPVAVLPFQIARAIWMAFNLILWNIGLWKLSEIFKWPPKGWRRYSLFTLVTLSFAWITWRYEQAGILVFAILVAAILSIQNQQWFRSGFWMVLLLIKPNISLILVAGLSLWLIRKGQWKPILVMMLSLAVLLAISTWITPNWYQPFFEKGFGQGLAVALDGPGRVVAVRINTTFLDWLKSMGIGSYPGRIIYAFAILSGFIAFFLAVWRSKSLMQLTSISLLVSYALTPYALQYDYPPLVIVLFWALFLCTSSPKAMWGGLLLTGFVLSVSIWQQNISWGYWMVVGLIAMGIWGFCQDNS